jgi:hypothetical protein
MSKPATVTSAIFLAALGELAHSRQAPGNTGWLLQLLTAGLALSAVHGCNVFCPRNQNLMGEAPPQIYGWSQCH